jgi:hypothetical protein
MIPSAIRCPKCHHCLHGLPLSGNCPRCGRTYHGAALATELKSKRDIFLHITLLFFSLCAVVAGLGYYCFLYGFAGTHFEPHPLLGQFLSGLLAYYAQTFGMPVVGLSLLLAIIALGVRRRRIRAVNALVASVVSSEHVIEQCEPAISDIGVMGFIRKRWQLGFLLALITLTMVVPVRRYVQMRKDYAAIEAHGGSTGNRHIPILFPVLGPWAYSLYHDNFAKVTHVGFDGPIDEATVQMLNSISSVTRISFARNSVVDADLAPLANLKNIIYFDLMDCGIGDDGIIYLASLRNLETLLLRRTNVTDAGLKHLESLHSLVHLDLSETAVTDSGLAHLQPLRSLRWLHLHDTDVTEAGVSQLKSHVTSLQTVNWGGMHDHLNQPSSGDLTP